MNDEEKLKGLKLQLSVARLEAKRTGFNPRSNLGINPHKVRNIRKEIAKLLTKN